MPGLSSRGSTLAAELTQAIDKIDREIITLLRADARTTNKQIAQALKIAESTVAARIRGLSQRGVMRIVLLRDIRALGYDLLAHLDLYIEGRPTDEVARELAALDEVAVVSVFPSPPQITLHVNAANRRELSRFMTEELALVEGVQGIETSITLEVIKYVSEFGVLQPQ